MLETIGQPREAVKEYAPKIHVFKTNPEKIKEAKNLIMEIATDLEVGQVFDAKVVRVEAYGLFVQLPKGKQGLCHVSNLGQKFTDGLDKHFKVGDTIHVVISQIGQDGKIAVKRKLG